MVTGEGLLEGLQLLLGGDGAPVMGPGDLPAAVERLRSGDPVDFEGASGKLDFDPASGEVLTIPDLRVVRQDGRLTPWEDVTAADTCEVTLSDLPCACEE